MRQLGTLPDAPSARTLADYLLNLSIETRLEESAGGWVVWVCDEDRVPQAREEYQNFLKTPADDRYRQAARAADHRRADEVRAAAAARRRPRRRRPELTSRRLTILLIAASVIVTLMFHSRQDQPFVAKYLFIVAPVLMPGGNLGFPHGAPEVDLTEPWRLITPIFIHLSAWHLLFNMLWLIMMGGQIEARSGPGRLALLVVLFAVVSNLCQYFFSTVALEGARIVVKESRPLFGGMSGVVYGLFGYVWMKAVYESSSGLFVSPGNIFLMMAWLILCMTGALDKAIGGSIANTAHLAGLVLGILLGYGSAWWNGFGHVKPEPE